MLFYSWFYDLHLHLGLTFLPSLLAEEAPTLFRANSFTTAMLSAYQKQAALPYLHTTLRPLIREMLVYKHSFEVRPSCCCLVVWLFVVWLVVGIYYRNAVLLWFLFLLFLSPVAVEPRGVEGNRQLGAEPHFPRSLCRQVCRHTRPLARLLPHVRSSLLPRS